MIANYHTHTWRCKHCSGTERAFIEQAISEGLQVLGFADHTPYPFPDGYVSSFRMPTEQAEDYFTTLSDLKREYAGQIDIRIGVEAEYYPDHFGRLLEFLRGFPCEYILMGQHYSHNERDGVYHGTRTDSPQVMTHYVDQVLEGLSTGVFSYLCHPDLVYYVGDPELYRQEMTRLCRGVKALGLPLEINMLGLREDRWYPRQAFWEIAGQVGNAVVFGCDAHFPGGMTGDGVLEKAEALAAAHGLQVLQTVELRSDWRKER